MQDAGISKKGLGLGANDAGVNYLAEIAARRELSKIVPGAPTQDYVYLNVLAGDIGEDPQSKQTSMLNLSYQVLAVGPTIKSKIKPGDWVQITPGARIIALDWGEQRNVLIREFEIAWTFDQNPAERLKFELDVEKTKINIAKKGSPTKLVTTDA
jgi:hypothetical protein